MKILEKLKSLTPFKKKTSKEPTICEFILQKISARKKEKTSYPENLTPEEWKNILNEIAFAFKVKQSNTILKSPTRRRQREEKLKRSFKLFEVYIKYL